MKRRLVTVAAVLLSLGLVGCGSSSSSVDVDSMSDQELEEYMEEAAEEMEDLDEDELEELFEEASGETIDEEDEGEEAEYPIKVTSFSQLSDVDWESIVEGTNRIIKEDIDSFFYRVNMTDGSNVRFPMMSSYTDCLDNLRPAEACLATGYYENDESEWTSGQLYVLCYIDGYNLILLDDTDSMIDTIEIKDMVCLIEVGNGAYIYNGEGHTSFGDYYSNFCKILAYFDSMDSAKEYIEEISQSTLTGYKYTEYEYQDISSLDIHFPE